MAKDKELGSQMAEIVEQLCANAQQLVDHSQGTIAEEALTELQLEQQTLITSLTKLDKKYKKTEAQPLQELHPKLWKKMEKQLDLFAELNQTFIENINVRKGLIQFDLAEVKKARKTVSDVKGAYGGKKSRKGRINTLS